MSNKKVYLSYYNLSVLTFFFISLLFVYGRGVNFNAQLSEELALSKDSSKAPFLILSNIVLFFLKPGKSLFSFSYVRNYRLWGVYFLVLFFLVFTRGNFQDDFKNFGTIFFSYSLLFLILRFAYGVAIDKLEVCFIFISFGIVLLTTVFHLLQGFNIVFSPSRTENNFDRIGGMFYYAHSGAIMSIATLFSFNRFYRDRKILYLVISCICVIFLVATDTRSAWVATFCSLLFIVFRNISFWKLALFSILLYVVSISLSELISSTSSLASSSTDNSFRLLIWDYSFNLASEKLFNGYGSLNPFSKFGTSFSSRLSDPHNSLISLLLQSGLFAVIIYITIYFKNLIYCLKSSFAEYRFLFFFWLFFPFFWGKIYDHLSSFIGMYMMFTIYAFALYPNFKKK